MLKKIKNYLRNKKISIQTQSEIHRDVRLDKETYIEGRNVVGSKSVLNSVFLGRGSYIGIGCNLTRTKIGKYCSIASNVKVIAGEHPTKEWISTHPLFYSKFSFAGINFVEENYFQEFKTTDEKNKILVTIGNDVWIGANVCILNGVKIGDGAIIGAGAVVVKEVPSYAIVGGVPAKIIKYRFLEEEIKFLENYKWWNKEEKWLKEHALAFQNLKKFRCIKEK